MSVLSEEENLEGTSNVLIDWTSTRKRITETNKELKNCENNLEVGITESETLESSNSTPFAFVKKPRRCKLECCSPLWTAAMSSSDEGGHDTLSLTETTAVVFLPPPCEVSWFSGICSVSSKVEMGNNSKEDSDDPFMEKGVNEVDSMLNNETSIVRRSNIGLLGHELEIDDCLKCADGGYQNFRVAVTDQKGKRKGSVRVERTGGDFLELDSEHLSFTTTQSITQAAVVPLVLKYFPSVVQSLSSGNDSIALLKDCTICIGTLTIKALPMRSM